MRDRAVKPQQDVDAGEGAASTAPSSAYRHPSTRFARSGQALLPQLKSAGGEGLSTLKKRQLLMSLGGGTFLEETFASRAALS